MVRSVESNRQAAARDAVFVQRLGLLDFTAIDDLAISAPGQGRPRVAAAGGTVQSHVVVFDQRGVRL